MGRDIEIVPVDAAQVDIAREAHRRFGRGSGHATGLNFGDCSTYALSNAGDEPVLFTGDDVRTTDLACVDV